ncbi:MAG: response regulator [Bacteroidota bacterium]
MAENEVTINKAQRKLYYKTILLFIMLTATEKIETTIDIPLKVNSNGSVTAVSRTPFHVFLVDDDTMFLRSMEHHLQQKLKRNIKITSFPNGEECIKNLDQKPDVVVLDYILNGQYPTAINGVSVLRKIKQMHPNIVVIMVSGQDKMQVAIDTMKYGAFDYVIKNENAFLKVQNAIKNGMHNITLARELKNYKFWVRVVLGILGTAVLTAIVIQMFFPEYFDRG